MWYEDHTICMKLSKTTVAFFSLNDLIFGSLYISISIQQKSQNYSENKNHLHLSCFLVNE